jgi:DNA-binding transcriptional MerR regulator
VFKRGGIAALDVIRSMMRMGFSHEEIYDVLTGMGLPGEQVQLLIDRVSAEFEDAKLEPVPSRLGKEVEEIFKRELDEVKHEMLTRLDSISRELQLIKLELEKLSERVAALQTFMNRIQVQMKLLRKNQ